MDSTHSPASGPIAFISDVHGRLDALDAVLEETGRRGVTRVYVAGDLLTGGPDPLGVWRRLSEIKALCVRGVSDSALCSVDTSKLVPLNEREREKLDQFLWTRKAVGELVLESLRRLPLSLRVPLIDGSEVVVVHGSPGDPLQEISQDMDDDEVLALVADDPADVVVCGASHVPFQRALDGVHVVNVGSVGAAPEGRVAHYTILTPTPGLRTVEQNWVDY
ncbi:MAG TPA: metallophosphoesterase family protein [Polyangiaceae bacterium]|nr:metallophosphoesterase family protein [Polyangiaceae bacterium]